MIYIFYDLRFIHEDLNLAASFIIKIRQVPPPILGSPAKDLYQEFQIFLFWPRTSFTFRGLKAPENCTYTVFYTHGREFTKFRGGGGGCSRSSSPDAWQTDTADLETSAGRPACPDSGGALTAGPGRRPDEHRRVHSPSPPPRGHLAPRKLQQSPNLTGKQQLPKRGGARPERRLHLPQRRAPFSERKCLSGGRAGLPGLSARRADPAPGGCTRLSSASGCEGVKGWTLRGRPAGTEEPPHPEAPSSGLARPVPQPPARRPAPRPRHVRPRAERKPGKRRLARPPRRRVLTHPWPRRRSAHCGD